MLWVFGGFYLLCSLITYSGSLAYWQRKYPFVKDKKDAGISIFFAIFGPLGLLIIAFTTSFFSYGFIFIGKDSEWRKIKREAERRELIEARKKYRPF